MSASFSPCGTYRYHLRRMIPGDLFSQQQKRVLFVMLNPSTADANLDDPTIRRCIGFAERENATMLDVVNLYAYRSPEPKALLGAADPVGRDNDEWIHYITPGAVTVAAWGTFPYERMPAGRDRVNTVLRILREHGPVHALNVTKHGFPSHPLYLPADSPLVEYSKLWTN